MTHGKTYGYCENKCMVEVNSKEDQDAIDAGQNSKITALETSVAGKQNTLTAGTNITISGNTISAKDTTYSTASTSANGLMSSSDKSKLDGIATGANKTTVDSSLSSSSTNPVQNKVINDALAGKANSSHTHDDRYYTESEVDSKLSGKAGTSVATTSANGLMSSSDKSKLDGIATGANKTTVDSALSSSSTNPVQNKVINSALAGKLSTSGTAAKATADASGNNIADTYETKANAITGLSVSGRTVTYTKGDGTTGTITTQDSNTTYSVATSSANGLMSSSDKSKLDGIQSSADAVSFSRSLSSGTKIGTITINGTGTDLYCETNTDTNTTYSAGTGMSLSGTTFNHSNSVTAKTSYVGSATKVPMIKYDAQGHITGTSTATIYPPTTVGSAGQVWASDGSGAGKWRNMITISTSVPTSSDGEDGDVWFVYE